MRVGSISYVYTSQLGAMAAASSAGTGGDDRSNLPSSSSVSISNEAQSRYAAEVQAGESKYKVDPLFMTKDFPEDIMAEAKARLAEQRQAKGSPGTPLPGAVDFLPLLPENQELLAKFKAEMRSLNTSDPKQNRRFNELLNLTFTLQRTGWTKPMTEEDVTREINITGAMGLIQSRSPVAIPETSNDLPAKLPEPLEGWKRRWQEDGRTMPEVKLVLGRSFWLDLAAGAGIGEEDFLKSARELAQSFRGEKLTQQIEGLISDRYAEKLAAKSQV